MSVRLREGYLSRISSAALPLLKALMIVSNRMRVPPTRRTPAWSTWMGGSCATNDTGSFIEVSFSQATCEQHRPERWQSLPSDSFGRPGVFLDLWGDALPHFLW